MNPRKSRTPTDRSHLLRSAVVLTTCLLIATGSSFAADHRDAPAVLADPAADLNDVFAWMSPDTERVNLVLTVFPDATGTSLFSDAVQYVFHTQSGPAYGQLTDEERRIVCVFDARQRVRCAVEGGPAVAGDASDPTGLANPEGSLRVFAGPRNDSFFFNFSGFTAVADTVKSVASDLSFDEAGCPAIDEATSAALVGQLALDADGSAGSDDFRRSSVLALVVTVDRSLLAADGDVLAVWASTHRRP